MQPFSWGNSYTDVAPEQLQCDRRRRFSVRIIPLNVSDLALVGAAGRNEDTLRAVVTTGYLQIGDGCWGRSV